MNVGQYNALREQFQRAGLARVKAQLSGTTEPERHACMLEWIIEQESAASAKLEKAQNELAWRGVRAAESSAKAAVNSARAAIFSAAISLLALAVAVAAYIK
ncbi:hypothetical protein [Massilia sp. NR 4-1]|uniref:hypothetical protein n=1 Tax=Massilia sp. NR 4-1 TaxID=1678028 RepID=UPI00067C52D8|nr:hypothetical protein [Massilia sp. NR 4-1]AKU21198.1 hypothetical protein ACZ75_06610 [Massilia sp. NR 4-1]